MVPSEPVRVVRMFRQSGEVVRRPGVRTFEQFERDGTFLDAVVYVALIAAVVSLLSLFDEGDRVWKASTLTVTGMWLAGTVATVGGFVVFVLVLYRLGRRYGGTGTLNEVAYTFSLFVVPLTVVVEGVMSAALAVPFVGELLHMLVWFAGVVAAVLFGITAMRSSLNHPRPERLRGVLVPAYLASEVTQWLLRGLLS